MKISIIIPCYNEEEGIAPLVSRINPVFEGLKREYYAELVFVDDGSRDKTNELLHEHYKNINNVKIVKHEVNKNVGAALRTGFANATGDIIVTTDSDCTYAPEEIPSLIQILLGSDADIVTGSPYHKDGKVENVPNYRLFLSKSISLIYKFLTWRNIATFTAIFRAYKKEAINSIQFKSDNFLAPAEILIRAIFNGNQIKEYPTTLHVRKYGVSKMKLLKTIKSHLLFVPYVIKLRIFG